VNAITRVVDAIDWCRSQQGKPRSFRSASPQPIRVPALSTAADELLAQGVLLMKNVSAMSLATGNLAVGNYRLPELAARSPTALRLGYMPEAQIGRLRDSKLVESVHDDNIVTAT
jgi:hypothetical protein